MGRGEQSSVQPLELEEITRFGLGEETLIEPVAVKKRKWIFYCDTVGSTAVDWAYDFEKKLDSEPFETTGLVAHKLTSDETIELWFEAPSEEVAGHRFHHLLQALKLKQFDEWTVEEYPQ